MCGCLLAEQDLDEGVQEQFPSCEGVGGGAAAAVGSGVDFQVEGVESLARGAEADVGAADRLGQAAVFVFGVDDHLLDAAIQRTQDLGLDQIGLTRAAAAEHHHVVVVCFGGELVHEQQPRGGVAAVEHPLGACGPDRVRDRQLRGVEGERGGERGGVEGAPHPHQIEAEGQDSAAQMDELGYELGSLSGRHVFNAVLGAQKAWWGPFYDVMEAAADDLDSLEAFRAAYPHELQFERDSAVNCGLDAILGTLLPFRQGVTRAGAVFVAENFPHLTTGALEGGIYRWKLPTVYDMAAWVSAQDRPVDWTAFCAWYQGFNPGQRLTDLVSNLWDSGELFVGTTVTAADDFATYVGGDTVTETAHTTLVARRAARR